MLDVRHASFRDPAFIALAREHRCAVVFTDAESYPSLPDVTADFVYARLLMTAPDQPTGYSADALDRWAERARAWSRGERPADLQAVNGEDVAAPGGRDVFMYFINGAKERNPAAADALLRRLGLTPLV